jgi:hypothetical protein
VSVWTCTLLFNELPIELGFNVTYDPVFLGPSDFDSMMGFPLPGWFKRSHVEITTVQGIPRQRLTIGIFKKDGVAGAGNRSQGNQWNQDTEDCHQLYHYHELRFPVRRILPMFSTIAPEKRAYCFHYAPMRRSRNREILDERRPG